MWAVPVASKWVSSASRRLRPAGSRQHGAGGGLDVGLAHQAFADQEGAGADRGHAARSAGERGRFRRPATRSLRHQRRQLLGGVEVDLEGACRLRLLTPIRAASSVQRAIELGRIMHLDQHVHAPVCAASSSSRACASSRRGHDQQDAVGAQRAGLGDLVGVDT